MSISPSQTGGWFRACASCGVLLAVSAAAGGQGPEASSSGPATSAPSATRPAPTPPPAAATAVAPGKMGALLKALRLTDAQADSYGVAMSRKNLIDDGLTFTMFLRKVAGLPKLQAAEWGELDRPGYGNLLADPNHYAGRPMLLKVFPNRVRKWTPGVEFRASADWTREDGPIYSYECLWADPSIQVQQPLIVFFPQEPNDVLGRPSSVDKETGVWIYDKLRTVQVTGVFYKLYQDKEANSDRVRDYPVVLAWQMLPTDSRGITPSAETWTQALGVGIVLFFAIAAYFFWRVRMAAKGIRKGPPRTPYARRETRQETEETSPEEDQADPDLAAAAEEFRKQQEPKET